MQSNSTPGTTELQSVSRDAFWHRHVTQWQTSELSKRAYCLEYDLVYHQMVYWCSKHKAANADEPTTTTVLDGFVPVTVAPSHASIGLSIRLPNGLLIEGIDQHNVKLLGQIVQQL